LLPIQLVSKLNYVERSYSSSLGVENRGWVSPLTASPKAHARGGVIGVCMVPSALPG